MLIQCQLCSCYVCGPHHARTEMLCGTCLIEQLKPLAEQLNKIKDLPIPEFGTLQAWEVRAGAAACAAGDNSDDPSRSTQAGTSMPFLGDTKVEVLLSGVQAKEDLKSETTSEPMKILPPWMIKQGMILTKEQRGQVKEGVKAYGNSASSGQGQEAAQKRQESSYGQSSGQGPSSERQVGLKSKREHEDEDDVEWEEAVPTGNIGEIYKANDLNVKVGAAVAAAAAAAADDDDVEWEEG